MKSFKAFLVGAAIVFLSLSSWAEVAERIVAVVNDEVITLSELNNAFEPYREKVEATYRGGERERVLTEARLTLLNRMIDEILMEQQSRKSGIVVKNEEIDSAIKDMLGKRKISPEDLQKTLDREGTTLEAYRKGVRDQIMRIRLVQREIKSRVAVSEQEIGEYYRKHREDYEGKEAVRIKQILLPLPKGADPAQKEKLRGEAEAIRRRLVNGESFDLLFVQYSKGPAASGADIGYVERGMILPEVETAAFSLPLKGISDVIESSVGFHLVQVIDRRGAGIKSIESVREEIREKIDQEKMDKKFGEWIEDLRKKSYIEIKL